MLNMKKYCEIQDRVADYIIDRPKMVIYSAYKDDKDGAIDNLDEVPIEGKVVFFREKDNFMEVPFLSETFNSPTWLEICKCANDSIILTGDHHHVYLEDVEVVNVVNQEENKMMVLKLLENDGFKIARLIMGS